jgi:hypothetical protein
MNRHEIFPDLHSFRFKQTRFNMEFTPEPRCETRVEGRIPTINYALPAFTENKRYRIKPRAIGDVVNPNAGSVYQTDAVLILAGGVQRRRSGAPTTKQYRVRRCPTECILPFLPAHLF